MSEQISQSVDASTIMIANGMLQSDVSSNNQTYEFWMHKNEELEMQQVFQIKYRMNDRFK